LPPITSELASQSRSSFNEMLWQPKVLLTKRFTSSIADVPAKLSDSRYFSDSHFNHRLMQLTEGDSPTRSGSFKRRKLSPVPPSSARESAKTRQRRLHANTARIVEESFEHALETDQSWLPVAPFDVKHTGNSGFSQTSPMPSSVAQAATAFLQSPPGMLKHVSTASMAASLQADLGKAASGGSLARDSTKASLTDRSVASVADVWKECLHEVQPRHAMQDFESRELVPSDHKRRTGELPKLQSPRYLPNQTPRGLNDMQGFQGSHRRGAPSYAEAPCHGTPRILARMFQDGPDESLNNNKYNPYIERQRATFEEVAQLGKVKLAVLPLGYLVD